MTDSRVSERYHQREHKQNDTNSTVDDEVECPK